MNSPPHLDDPQHESCLEQGSTSSTGQALTKTTPSRGTRFWMVFIAGLTVDLLSALDLTAVSTALPTIVHHLNGSDFIWVGSAYSIGATAVLPLVGGVVSIFGRKPILLVFIIIFAIGSAICGAAQNINMLIAGRALQGFGGSGCVGTTMIVYADLIPLPERGKFQGITASVWAFACAIGPPIGGALATSGAWRWLFFLNLPICVLAAALVVRFLQIRTPRESFRNKLAQMDWIGLFVIIGGIMCVTLALTWGGVRYAWVSVQVLVPLCLGVASIIFFFVIEAYWVNDPTVPPFIVSDRTTLSGYISVFFHGIVSMAIIFYLPVYFQATHLASAIQSGVDMFGTSFVVPVFAIGTGISVQIFKRYRPQNHLGWMLIVIGFGVLSLLDENTSKAKCITYQVVLAAGIGIVWISTDFPILAPLPFSNNAHALGFMIFVRCSAQGWGIIVGGAILQNGLRQHLPSTLMSSLPQGTQLTYSVIPLIPELSDQLQADIRVAFARSIRLIWKIMIGFSAAGMVSSLLMREVPLRITMDETWGLKEGEHEVREDKKGHSALDQSQA